MLNITIPEIEEWDEIKECFVHIKGQKIALEHSLVSLSKWESQWCKPFLTSEKSETEMLDYIRCMTITQNVNPDIYTHIGYENIHKIYEYIDAPMTATTIHDMNKGGSRRPITSEIIYFWMMSYNIPFECQKWHLTRLLTLIKVCELENRPPKKMSRADIMKQQASLNAARRKKYNTRG